MDYAFDYYQHNYCITIYLNDWYGQAKCLLNRQRNYPSLSSNREAACIAYNLEGSKILAWGDAAQRLKKNTKEDIIYRDNFIRELERVYPKYKQNANDKDVVEVLQSVTDYLLNLVNSLKSAWLGLEESGNSLDINLHFVFIVPTEWEHSMREDLIRPLFIAAGLISKTDHPNRLLFYTKLESIIQLIQHPKYGIEENIRPSTQYIMCCTVQSEEGFSVKLDLFEFEHSTVGIGLKPTLVPHTSKSVRVNINLQKIRSDLKQFIEKLGIDPVYVNDKNIDTVIQQFLSLEMQLFRKNSKASDRSIRIDRNEWPGLNENQVEAIKSITLEDIYQAAFASIAMDLENGVRDVLSDSFHKIRSLISLKEAIYDSTDAFPIFFKWITATLDRKGNRLNYSMLIIGDTHFYLKLKANYIIEGAGRKILEQIKVADSIISPKVIRRDTFDGPLMAEDLHKEDPDVVVMLDMSFKQVLYSCALMDGDHIEKVICHGFPLSLKPLESFFSAPNQKNTITLRIEKNMETFLETHFKNSIDYFSKYDRQLERKKGHTITITKKKPANHFWSILRHRRARLGNSESVSKATISGKENVYETKELFSNQMQLTLKSDMELLLSNERVRSEHKLQTQQNKYIKSFLVIYFGYLNQLIQDQLKSVDGYEKKKIGYVLFFEKHLDNVIGDRMQKKELLIASNLFQKQVKSKEIKILSQGEGILPVIQQELEIELPLKSYYVLSHIRENNIQLTLYQVVRTTGIEEEATAISLQNELISIENMYQSLCKYLWHQAGLDQSLVQSCDSHRNDFLSLKYYKSFLARIKSYILRKFSSSQSNLDLVDEKEMIPINSECKCRINFSIRDILEVAFRPVIKEKLVMISSSLKNQTIFGKYNVEYLFITGNLFELSYDTLLGKTISSMIQEILDSCIEQKELDVSSYVLFKSTNDILRPKIGLRHPLHEIFHKGCLHQVSHENYGLDFYNKKTEKSISISFKDGKMEHTVNAGDIVVMLRRGQLISYEGCGRIFKIESKSLNFGEHIFIRLLKFNYLKETNNGDIVPLRDISCDVVRKFTLKKSTNSSVMHVVVKMKPKNYFSSLSFFARILGDNNASKSSRTFVYVGEQLTVAYF